MGIESEFFQNLQIFALPAFSVYALPDQTWIGYFREDHTAIYDRSTCNGKKFRITLHAWYHARGNLFESSSPPSSPCKDVQSSTQYDGVLYPGNTRRWTQCFQSASSQRSHPDRIFESPNRYRIPLKASCWFTRTWIDEYSICLLPIFRLQPQPQYYHSYIFIQ